MYVCTGHTKGPQEADQTQFPVQNFFVSVLCTKSVIINVELQHCKLI